MKKRKILYLFPLVGFLLTGCTIQEGWESTKGWFETHLLDPVKNIFNKKDSSKEEKKSEDEKTMVELVKVEAPEEIEVGQELLPAQVKCTVKFSDGSQEVKNADKVVLDTSVANEAATGKAIIGSLSKNFTIRVYEVVIETYTPEEVIAKCDAAGSGKVTELLRVRGTVAFGSTVDKNGWSGEFIEKSGEKVLTFGSATTSESYKTLDYATVVIEGYAELFNGVYKVAYLPATASPTGSKYNPELISVTPGEQKVVQSITNVDAPATIYVGETLDPSEVTLTVEYEDGETGFAHPDTVVLDTETAAQGVVGTVTLGQLEHEFTINVVEHQTVIEHAGTEEDPYTISDAKIRFDALEPKGYTEEIYVTGVIVAEPAPSIYSGRGQFYLTDGKCPTDLYVYNINNIGGKADLTVEDLVVGSTVLAKGAIKNFVSGSNNIFELCYVKAEGEYPGANCELISIEAPKVPVTGVELSEQHLDLEEGQQAALTASVLPAEASQDVEWTIEQEGEVVSYEEGKVLALAEGEATVIATSVADPEKSASCTVTVTAATKTLESIAIEGELEKTSYEAGEAYSAAGLKVMAHYDKGEDEDVTANATLTPEKEFAEFGDEEITFEASYGTAEKVSKKFTGITVTAKPGSKDAPFTVAEAREAATATIAEGTYVSGIIYKVDSFNSTYGSLTYWISDDGTGDSSAKDGLQIYSGLNIGGEKFTGTKDLVVGDEVVVTGGLKIYTPSGGGDSIYELDKNNQIVSRVEPAALSVEISGSVEKTEYYVGDDYKYKGLVATAHLENGVDADVTEYADWVVDPETASENETGFTVTATFRNKPSEVFEVTGITVSTDTPPAPSYQDAAMAAGTNASACKINDLDGIKVGTGKADGNMTITVEKGATELKLYAVAWKGAAGKVNLAASVGTLSVSELTLVADDGLSNNSPFTLNADLETFVFTVTLSDVTADSTITVSSGTARRFAVWGAQFK